MPDRGTPFRSLLLDSLTTSTKSLEISSPLVTKGRCYRCLPTRTTLMSHRFLNWNMPFAASKYNVPQSPKYTPPFGIPISTPDGVVIRTPSHPVNSPSQAISPHDMPSPLSAAVTEAM